MIFSQHLSSACLGAATLLSALAWFPSSNAFFTTTTSAGMRRGPIANDASSSLVPRGNKVLVLPPLGAPCVGSKGLLNGSLFMSKNEDERKSARKDHLMKVIQESNAMVTVDTTLPTIDDFIYTEALLADQQDRDEEKKQALKTTRQSFLNFITDVNSLQVEQESAYLEGQVFFPLSKRTLKRDEDSTNNKLSSLGVVLLLEASVKEIGLKTNSLGPAEFSKYTEEKEQTANSFNLDTVISACTNLVSSFESASLGGISKAAESIGTLLSKSTETQSSSNPISTLSITSVIDFDPIFDEVTGSVELILFEFDFQSFTKIEQNKGTSRIEEIVKTSTTLESTRNSVNLKRLVDYYYPPGSEQILDENPVGPGGNVATLLAPGASLLPLPKPDNEFLSDLRKKIYDEWNVRATRHPSGDYVPQALREPGYKVIRTKKGCLDTRS